MTPEPPPLPEPGPPDKVLSTTPPGATPEFVVTAESLEPLPACLAEYEQVFLLQQGGMGVVYRAVDPRLDRAVALKMIRADRLTPGQLQRFRVEAKILAKLDHPHIVRVYSCPEVDGQPVLVMEYVAGGSLEALLRARRLAVEEAARLVALLAGAVQAAHEAGVVHRDLKPENVLLSPPLKGVLGMVAGHVPKISDFGLAYPGAGDLSQVSQVRTVFDRPAADGPRLTQTRDMIGTPGYMAPEQTGEDIRAVGPAADVWALGVILYRCLTGRLPFGKDNLESFLDRVRNHPPEPLLPEDQVPAALEAVCLRCLEKSPPSRPLIGQLAGELEQFLARPVAPLPPTVTVPPPQPQEQLPAEPPPAQATPRPARRKRRAPARLAGMRLAILVVSALVGFVGGVRILTDFLPARSPPLAPERAAYGVIQIGGRGVRMAAVELLTTAAGADWRVLARKEVPITDLAEAVSTEGPPAPGKFNALRGHVRELSAALRAGHSIPPSRVYIVCSGVALSRLPGDRQTRGRAALRDAIEAPGERPLDFVSLRDEVRLAHLARVPPKERHEWLLLDVGGLVKAGYFERGGQFSGFDPGVGRPEQRRPEQLTQAIRGAVGDYPGLRDRAKVCLCGDAPRAMVRFARPQAQGEWVEIGRDDCRRYRALVNSSADPAELKRRALQDVQDPDVRRQAELNLDEVLSASAAPSLRPGAELLVAVQEELKLDGKQVMFHDLGDIAWALGYLLEKARDPDGRDPGR